MSCKTREQITSNGQIINNNDGTISAFVVSPLTGQYVPYKLTKPCCEILGGDAYFDIETQTCRWSKKDTNECDFTTPFNIILNPKGNDGTIFYPIADESCTLNVEFDYLFKFDCNKLTDFINGEKSNCKQLTDIFETLGATMSVDIIKITPFGINLSPVYSKEFFTPVGTNNLNNYLISNSGVTGYYICQSSTSCSDLNLYDAQVNTQSNCKTFVQQILTSLSGVPSDSFASNWLNYSTEITDPIVLSAITNQKIKLSVTINGMCVDGCILLDNIKLSRNCKKVDKNSVFLSKSPGFELDRIIDNKKSWVGDEDETHRIFRILKTDDTQPIRNTDYYLNSESQVLNSKEIDLDIDIAAAVETDVWCYISDNPCILTGVTIGTATCVKDVFDGTNCVPKTYCCSEYCGDANIDLAKLLTQDLSQVTTIEDFKYYLTSELIDVKTRQSLSAYPTLRLLYERYLNSLNFCTTKSARFDYFSIEQFTKLIGNYWVELIEQVIPATTIWGSTIVYTNTIFDTQKYKYKNYTSFFGVNKKCDDTNVLSPTSGITCSGVNVTTTVIQGGTDASVDQNNTNSYDSIYITQMNSGPEFIGSVSIIGGDSPTICNDVIVLNECLIGVSLTVVQPSINQSNGSITANVVGASGPVTYLWNNNATTSTINGLSGGTYSVTVTDTNIKGCTATANVKLIDNSCTLTGTTITIDTTGNTNTGSITAIPTNGEAPYIYNWNTIPAQTAQTATGLSASTYNVTIMDADNCTVTLSGTVNQINGKMYVGGSFTTYNSVGNNYIIKLDEFGVEDTSFNNSNSFNNQVKTIAKQTDNKILVGGAFTTYSGQSSNRIIRLNSDGTIDTSFVIGTGFSDNVASIFVQSDNKILVGGSFTTYSGQSTNRIIRLNSNGGIDTSFTAGTGFNNIVWSIDVQSDNKILVGGDFTDYNGTTTNYIARLNSDGSIDSGFEIGGGFDDSVRSVIEQSDGKKLICGDFTSYDSESKNSIIRINTDGSIDTSFEIGVGFNGPVFSTGIQSDNKIVVVGFYTSYSGASANYIIRLNTNGTIDTSFTTGTGFDLRCNTVTIQYNGKILVGGEFTNYNGTTSNYIANLNSNGTINTSFALGTGFNASVRKIIQFI